jgi:hypothetical protein
VARHILQARPVWIYTQSTSIRVLAVIDMHCPLQITLSNDYI